MIGRIRAVQKEFLLALVKRPGSQSATCSDLIKIIVFLVSVSRDFEVRTGDGYEAKNDFIPNGAK
jgi:hypothetical protein